MPLQRRYVDPECHRYERIGVRFIVKGDAPREVLEALVEQSRSHSAVFDIIANQVPVNIEVDAR